MYYIRTSLIEKFYKSCLIFSFSWILMILFFQILIMFLNITNNGEIVNSLLTSIITVIDKSYQ